MRGLREAHLAVDGAYTKLIEFLNALLVNPTEELLQLEKVLNADIRLLEAQLAASRKKQGGEDEPVTATPEPAGTMNAEDVE